MKVAICDDSREYRALLRAYAEEYFSEKHMPLELFEFACGGEISASAEVFDIALLDIELGDSNGIEIAGELQRKNKKTVILIVTSHSQYLDDAMDIHAVRFVNKPVSRERIFSALEKAVREIDEKMVSFRLKNNQLLRLYASDVVYIEVKLKRVTLYTADGSYEVQGSLKTISEQFNASFFAVPHNSYIVNLNYVKSFKRDEIKLLPPYDNVRISVASRKQSEFRKKIFEFVGDDYSAKNSH
ncbi:MAG: response regulator transcription factor [Clostridia bacterium]|nr:response regulator transcription factor [Clostridia bacterium]